MKSSSWSAPLLVTALALTALPQLASAVEPEGAVNLVQWDFNSPPGLTPATGAGTWVVLGNLSVTNAAGTGSSDPVATGDQSLALSRFPAVTNTTIVAGVEFRCDTTGFRNLGFRCDLRATGSASRQVQLDYSIDSGLTFQTGTAYVLTNANAFTKGLTLDLGAVPEVADRTDVRFRIVSAAGPGDVFEGVSTKYSPNGSWRLDMVTVTGTPLVEPPPPEPPVPAPAWSFVNVLSGRLRGGEPQTNSFPEISLRFGQSLRIEARASDTNERPVRLIPRFVTGQPEWTLPDHTDAQPGSLAVFTHTATSADAGQRWVLELAADNGAAVSQKRWIVYIPTAAEQGIVINEFLADPPAFSATNRVDALGRNSQSAGTGTGTGEFVELANAGQNPVDLTGWTLRDATSLRHRFGGERALTAGGALLIYGGPRTNGLPQLSAQAGPAVPASSGGLSLNNSGDTLELRNAASNLIDRVVYQGKELGSGGSLVRQTVPDGGFVPHQTRAGNRWSPGLINRLPVPTTSTAPSLTIHPGPDGIVNLRWVSAAEQPVRVLRARDLESPWVVIATGLVRNEHQDLAPEAHGFYRLELE